MRQLQRGADRSVRALHARIYGFLAQHNKNPKPFVRTKTADAILASVARLCQRTSNSEHQAADDAARVSTRFGATSQVIRSRQHPPSLTHAMPHSASPASDTNRADNASSAPHVTPRDRPPLLQDEAERTAPAPPEPGHHTRDSALGWWRRRRLARRISRNRRKVIAAWAKTQFNPDRLRRFEVLGVGDESLESSIQGFVRPLLELLLAWIRTGEGKYRSVYLDERLRYAPFRASPATRLAYFREILPDDELAVLQQVPADSAMQHELQRLLRELHAPLLSGFERPMVRILALGDCLLNELRVFLPAVCRDADIGVDMRNLYFSSAVGRQLDVTEVLAFLEKNPTDLIALSFLTYEGIPAYRALLNDADSMSPAEVEARTKGVVDLMGDFLNTLRAQTEAPFLLHNASGLPLARWRRHVPFIPPLSSRRRRLLDVLNRCITELAANTPNTILIDEFAIAEGEKHRQCERMVIPSRVVRGAFFHTSRFGASLCAPYSAIVRAYRKLHKAKVVLVDFDMTLWDGVMADGPVRQHHDRQTLLRRLKQAGMLLVAVSKNDTANIRWGEMTLQPTDFVLQKINWRLKAESIQEAARELDLGLSSLVLVDDNPAERELVRSALPEVEALDSLDPFTWRALDLLLQFPNTRETEEARTRTEMYRQQAARRSALTDSFDYAAMMAGLELEVGFGNARPNDLERIAELVQRTNQFNTTTIRYTRQELASFLESTRHRVYVATLADKFGSLGLVVAAIIERDGRDAVFNSFVMSCRAMGFQLERMVARLVMDAESDAERFVGRFVPTDRNTPAESLFRECGFVSSGAGDWLLQREMTKPAMPEWIRVVRRA